MTTVRVLPHPHLCPDGVHFESAPGESLCDALLAHGVHLEHACEKVAACATCHVYVRQGGASLAPSADQEEDQLDAAWALQADSRLACCVRLSDTDLLIEIPKHSRNHAREHG
ncbi:ISC system 2Fe-2S type ferredoxin [Zoogloea sp.]|uniref:ISC system 2Fe-2S type ferredoxin n=1 Tax=Zoogloea sp. TaxID=49181 RepID=UPI002590A880|nr:ISC system 2Fe-2S type ferredoxin [Zoogloea sp.]MDD2668459.1 ISC system 2Fe-2S type ferredoxin [Zoogloea sp.]